MNNTQIINEYKQFLVWKNLSSNSIRRYISVVNEYLNILNLEINKKDFSLYIEIEKEKLKPNSFRTNMLIIYQFLKFKKVQWLQEWKDNFKLPPVSEEPQLVLNKDQINNLILSLNLKRFYQFKQYIWVKFLFETGMRVSEFASIKKSDIINNSIQIIGKGRKQRKIFITEEMKNIVSYWPFESFCVNKKGEILTTKHIRYLIKKIGLKNGYNKLTPHTLRRSFCTHLIKSNSNIKAIQIMMGHSSIAVTSRYIHLSEQEIYKEYLKGF